MAPKRSNSKVPMGEICVNEVWNSNLVLKFWARGRVFQDLRRRISLCTTRFYSEPTKWKAYVSCYNVKKKFKTQVIYANKMLSIKAISVFILHNHQNGLCNKNLRSIQDIMRASDPAAKKYKRFAMTSLISQYSPRSPHQAKSN